MLTRNDVHIETRRKRLWLVRYFGGAAVQAMTRIVEIVAIKVLVDAVEHRAGMVSTVAVFIGLYGAAHIVKALAQIDKVTSAEAIARIAHVSEMSVSWGRIQLIEQHLVVSSVLSGLLVCAFVAWLVPMAGAAFAAYLLASLALSGFYARTFRAYHNRAYATDSGYARLRKRTIRANAVSTAVHFLGVPLFGLLAWLALDGQVSIGDAVILFLAAKLLINTTSSLASPLLRMARAQSQVDINKRAARKPSPPRARS